MFFRMCFFIKSKVNIRNELNFLDVFFIKSNVNIRNELNFLDVYLSVNYTESLAKFL